MEPADPLSFNRLVVLFNPEGTSAPKVKKIITSLEKAHPGKVVVDETKPSVAGNLKVLKKVLKPGDILLPCGGDGTLGQVVSALLDPTISKAMQSIPVLPVGTGKMNDVAHMLNGRHFANPLYVLRHAQLTPIYPLTCTITPANKAGKPDVRMAVYNIGFGSIGLGTVHYNEPEYRDKQKKRPTLVQDLVAVGVFAKTWREAAMFDVTYKGKRQQMLDLFFSNGNIMAGYWRFPAKLQKKEFFVGIVSEKTIRSVTRTAVGLLANKFPTGELTKDPVEFTLHEEVYAEIDGEWFTTPPSCKVHISHHRQPVMMLATAGMA